MSKVEHPLKPVYDEHSRVLILGSMPSVASRSAKKYYAHPQNRFWRIMEALYDEKIDDWQEFILKHHLALWDVIASCEIEASSDASIRAVIPNDIANVLEKTEIKHVFLLGKSAYSLYEKYVWPTTHIEGFYLPSPSTANAAWHLDELIREYRIIKTSAE